jgi:hypothetical protein
MEPGLAFVVPTSGSQVKPVSNVRPSREAVAGAAVSEAGNDWWRRITSLALMRTRTNPDAGFQPVLLCCYQTSCNRINEWA